MPNEPPHNHRAEQTVLGSSMHQPTALDDMADVLCPDDFHHPGHRAVWLAMQHLAARGQPIDPVTLESRLRAVDQIGLVGGLEGIGRLGDSWASWRQARFHALTLRRLGIQRRMVDICRRVIDEGCEERENLADWIASVEERLLAVASRTASSLDVVDHKHAIGDAVRRLADEAMAAAEARAEGRPLPVTGVPTGFSRLDHMLGGLQPTDLIVLAARPSMGKTALALNITTSVARAGIPVLFFSLEMSSAQLRRRQICTEVGIDSMGVRDGLLTSDDYERLVRAADVLGQLPIVIDERPALSITTMRSAARRWRRDRSRFQRDDQGRVTGHGLIVIDYLQLARGEQGSRPENRNIEVGQISAGGKAMAKELGVPVLALSQLNRAVDNRADHRPVLSDLRDSGTIEQDADVIAFIYRESRYDPKAPPDVADLDIAKHRNGPTGRFPLHWSAEHQRFSDPP